MRSSLNSFGYFFNMYLVLFIAMNEINSRFLLISENVINFQGKILIFKEFEAPLEKHFIFQHLLKSSRTCTNTVVSHKWLHQMSKYVFC